MNNIKFDKQKEMQESIKFYESMGKLIHVSNDFTEVVKSIAKSRVSDKEKKAAISLINATLQNIESTITLQDSNIKLELPLTDDFESKKETFINYLKEIRPNNANMNNTIKDEKIPQITNLTDWDNFVDTFDRFILDVMDANSPLEIGELNLIDIVEIIKTKFYDIFSITKINKFKNELTKYSKNPILVHKEIKFVENLAVLYDIASEKDVQISRIKSCLDKITNKYPKESKPIQDMFDNIFSKKE